MRRCLNCMSEYLDQYEDRCPHCGYLHGTTQSGATDLAPGSILQGRYIIGTAIRTRDTDIFYNGWDALFDRRVIIQEYFPKYCAARSANGELSAYESKADACRQGLELFYFQSRELIRFYKDEDIITYHACFRANKTAYAVMEHRNYQTLRAWSEERAVDSQDALEILKDLIRIVGKCHDLGIIHGMIDLDAVWLTGEGKLVLKDFGSWRYISGEPGIVSYRNASAATDVYRLAVLFGQLVTGSRTEDGEKLTAELLRNRFRLKNQELRAVKDALGHDIGDLSAFYMELEGREAPAAAGPTPAQTASKRAKRRDAKHSLSLPKWAWAAAGAAALLVLVITIIAIKRIKLESGTGELAQTQVRVPNVIGMDADQVESMLHSMGLKLEQEQMNYSDEVAEDKISFQSPAAGAVLEKGDAVTVYISKGKEKAEVPLVKGMDEEEAKKLLSEAGFHEISIVEAPESQLKYGTVLTIAVEEKGTEKTKELVSIIDQLLGSKRSETAQKQEKNLVPLDTKIVLTVSRHKLQPEEIEVTIPEIVGMNLEQAKEAIGQIEEKELILQPQEEYSNQPVGEIISQEPEAGTVTRKNYITIVVSKGQEKVTVTNLELMTSADAEDELKALGLKIGTVREEYSDSIAKGKVISQSAEADSQLEKGASVDLVVSKGAKPAEKPAKKETAAATKAPKATKAAPKTTAAVTEAVTEAETETSSEAAAEAMTEVSMETATEASSEASTEENTSDSKENAIEVGEKPTGKEPGIIIDPNPEKTTEASDSGITVGEGPGQ